jgi:hypothetical protein
MEVVTMQSKPRIEISLAMLALAMVVGLSLMVGARPAEADESRTLAGLFGVQVVVESMDLDAARDGLTTSSLQTIMELRLRQAGIRVLTETENLRAPGNPYLYVNVGTGKEPSLGIYVYHLSLTLRERVRLDRNPDTREFAETWHARGQFGYIPVRRLHEVRISVEEQVDEFINAYLAANPKR